MRITELTAGLRLLWPIVEERDGCYVWIREDGGPSKEYIAEWLNYTKGNVKAAEKVMNHRHVAFPIPWADGHPSADDLRILAHSYIAILRQVLNSTFPKIHFTVETEDEVVLERNPGDYTVTFFRG